MFWELRCWSFIVVKQLAKPYTCAIFKIGLSSWHVIEQSTCYKYQKKLNEKQLEEREENVVEITYKSCGMLMLCPSHKHVGSGTRTCQQSLLVWNQGGLQHWRGKKKSSAGGNIGHGMRAKKKGCNFQGLCQANCQSFTQSYPRLWTILSAP